MRFSDSVASAAEIPASGRVVIRSHGVGRAAMEALLAQGFDVTGEFAKGRVVATLLLLALGDPGTLGR